jgi:hypothetical protein
MSRIVILFLKGMAGALAPFSYVVFIYLLFISLPMMSNDMNLKGKEIRTNSETLKRIGVAIIPFK